ncbi:MAG: methyltransferase [Bacteroidaceae bacterium]|nr:methyltransferase [Bacteroidaceae bacterium]
MGKKDFFQFKQFHIHQEHAAMKVGTDSDLLGALAAGGKRILDVGTGTGVLALMMAQRFNDAMVTAVEIDNEAVLDASRNFQESPFARRITLVHESFQQFVSERGADEQLFDAVVCNPPYFDRSLECPTLGRTRARHSSSLPFSVLAKGVSALLNDKGTFTVIIPPEVLSDFNAECFLSGFWLKDNYRIKSVPEKGTKRHILIYQKGMAEAPTLEHTCCMRNADNTMSDWYVQTLQDFLLD